MWRMKKVFLIIFGVLFVAHLAYAHPPLAINIKYDPETKQVTANIAHEVSNPKRHYINKVVVKINGVVVELKRLFFQTNAKEQIIMIAIPTARPGDVIVIEAYCNKGGRLAQEINVK